MDFSKSICRTSLDDKPAVILSKSVEETAAQLGVDQKNYQRILQPLAKHVDWLMEDSLRPFGLFKHPLFMTRFGMQAALPATFFSKLAFKGKRAKALFAGVWRIAFCLLINFLRQH